LRKWPLLPATSFSDYSSLSAALAGLEIAAMLLMLLGTQWYILFNVIAGAMAISDRTSRKLRNLPLRSWDRWRHLICRAFSVSRNGMVTGVGRRVDASIVAEYFHFQGRIVNRRSAAHQQRERRGPLRCATCSTLSWPQSLCSSIGFFGAGLRCLFALQARN